MTFLIIWLASIAGLAGIIGYLWGNRRAFTAQEHIDYLARHDNAVRKLKAEKAELSRSLLVVTHQRNACMETVRRMRDEKKGTVR